VSQCCSEKYGFGHFLHHAVHVHRVRCKGVDAMVQMEAAFLLGSCADFCRSCILQLLQQAFKVKGRRLPGLCDIAIAHHRCLCCFPKDVGMTGEDVLSNAICEESHVSCNVRNSASPCHKIFIDTRSCRWMSQCLQWGMYPL
jgi:hypothetical protein